MPKKITLVLIFAVINKCKINFAIIGIYDTYRWIFGTIHRKSEIVVFTKQMGI